MTYNIERRTVDRDLVIEASVLVTEGKPETYSDLRLEKVRAPRSSIIASLLGRGPEEQTK